MPDENFSKYCSSPSNSNGNFSLITHGSLMEIYGVQTLIRAVPLLIEKIPNLNVKVVGDGEYRSQLERLAQSLEITKYVDFVGHVDQAEVPGYITKADIGIVTILVKENPMLPNKLFEYLDLGKPIISAAIPAITTYFDDSSVMFFKPNDEHDLARCVLELYKNPERRAALAASGSAIYEKYRWTVMKHEYLRVFEQLTKSRR